MLDGLGLYLKDVYPNMGKVETSTNVTPDVSDQDALNEDVAIAENASVTESGSKKILIALGILVLVVVFLGMGAK